MYPMYQFPQQFPPVNARFVTSIEEAKASMIDGISTNLFLDTSTGKIYLKKVNNNGIAEFIVYSIEEQKPQTDPIKEINERLSKIEKYIGGRNESISDDGKPEPVYHSTVAEQNERYDETEPTGLSENPRNDKWQERR